MTDKKEVTATAYMNCLDEVLRVRAERNRAREAVRFFASVIKCGEPWSEQCEAKLLEALEKTYGGA